MQPGTKWTQLIMDLDHIDRQILRELQLDGRIANTKLAETVGLSPSACLRRVQALEAAGVIKDYRAVVDPAQTGQAFLAYLTVGLSEHTKAAQERFERAMIASPEVRECHNITGTVEYLLRVEAADLARYKAFHTDRLGTVEGVRQITTHMVMASPKDERG